MQTQRNEFNATIGPIFISCFVIFCTLLLESVALHYLSSFAPIIEYLTTTTGLLYCIFGTPYLTFKILEREKFYLKSEREKVYMQRLMLQLLFVVIIVPMIFNIILVMASPPGFR